MAKKLHHIISAAVHCHVASIIETFKNVTSILDVGGTGRLQTYTQIPVTDANLKEKIDGANLPFADEQFTITTSIATLEHAKLQKEFISEAYRVAKRASIHWFPAGEAAKQTEAFKNSLRINHYCSIPMRHKIIEFCKDKTFSFYPYITIREHLLLLCSLYKFKDVQKVCKFVDSSIGLEPYGYLLKLEK